MSEKMKQLEIEVFGRVQAVRLRKSVKEYADAQALKGYVENREDGSVEILVQGKEEELLKFLHFLQESPGFSKISGVNYKWRGVGKEYPSFEIVRANGFVLDQAKSLINLGKRIIDKKKVPEHLAIIPDGNRRWAMRKGFEGTFGHHKAGSFENLDELFREGKKLGVKYMSIWGFSTENWKRNEKEIEAIFSLILSRVQRFRQTAKKDKIRFFHVGRKDRIPEALRVALESLEAETVGNSDFNVVLCLDYGGRDEIVRAINKAVSSGTKEFDEESFAKYLDTKEIPEPDLIIRTGGEKRISGFMPFQGAYSEFYFVDKFFPDFNVEDLREAVDDFAERKRRFGG